MFSTVLVEEKNYLLSHFYFFEKMKNYNHNKGYSWRVRWSVSNHALFAELNEAQCDSRLFVIPKNRTYESGSTLSILLAERSLCLVQTQMSGFLRQHLTSMSD